MLSGRTRQGKLSTSRCARTCGGFVGARSCASRGSVSSPGRDRERGARTASQDAYTTLSLVSNHGGPAVALVGTTASGKSALAHQLCLEQRDVSILCVDAMTVYRGMDIGTAKPSLAQRDEVRYHLVDLIEPSEEFTLYELPASGARERSMRSGSWAARRSTWGAPDSTGGRCWMTSRFPVSTPRCAPRSRSATADLLVSTRS